MLNECDLWRVRYVEAQGFVTEKLTRELEWEQVESPDSEIGDPWLGTHDEAALLAAKYPADREQRIFAARIRMTRAAVEMAAMPPRSQRKVFTRPPLVSKRRSTSPRVYHVEPADAYADLERRHLD